MGGLFFALAISASAVVFAVTDGKNLTGILLILGFALLCGIIGFADDYVKLFKKTNKDFHRSRSSCSSSW